MVPIDSRASRRPECSLASWTQRGKRARSRIWPVVRRISLLTVPSVAREAASHQREDSLLKRIAARQRALKPKWATPAHEASTEQAMLSKKMRFLMRRAGRSRSVASVGFTTRMFQGVRFFFIVQSQWQAQVSSAAMFLRPIMVIMVVTWFTSLPAGRSDQPLLASSRKPELKRRFCARLCWVVAALREMRKIVF